jgi:hypothetical protein
MGFKEAERRGGQCMHGLVMDWVIPSWNQEKEKQPRKSMVRGQEGGYP